MCGIFAAMTRSGIASHTIERALQRIASVVVMHDQFGMS